MGKFHTPLRVEQISEATSIAPAVWKFSDPLIYESSKLGIVIVDRNELTNFASVPRLPFAYWLMGGRSNAPAGLHDKLYGPEHDTGRGKIVTRMQADNLIFEATVDSLEIKGYSLKSIIMNLAVYVVAGLTWVGVRSFGWLYWEK